MTDSPMTLSAHIDRAKNRHGLFREAVPRILETQLDIESIRQEMIDREEFRTDLQKLSNAISDRIGEMEAMKRRLSELKSEQRNDIDKLERRMFDLIRERKSHGL